MSNCSREDGAGDSENEESRQSESFVSLHHCTDDPSSLSTTVPLIYVHVPRPTESPAASFRFLKPWGADAQSRPPLLTFCVTGIGFLFFCSFLDSMIQEKTYLCVQILTNVC